MSSYESFLISQFEFELEYEIFLYFRQNNISELSEVTKLKCLPMLRALVLLGKFEIFSLFLHWLFLFPFEHQSDRSENKL